MEKEFLNELEQYFDELWSQSFLFQPSDLEKYKEVYDDFKNRDNENNKEQVDFENKILKNRNKKKEKIIIKISKNARLYNEFWRIVDEVKDYVGDISEKEYPGIPVYLTIDHFWHWVKTQWDKESHKILAEKDRKLFIQTLFNEYCKWDKASDNHTMKMFETSKSVFSSFLSPENIDNLSIAQAKQIYSSLHSGSMTARRFSFDETFARENPIEKIRSSLDYLLYSNDDIEMRIHNLYKNKNYSLRQFGFSAIQELLGWVMPKLYPLRNDKADDALNLIGYEFPRKDK